jgi:hypothetical protein
MSLPLGTSAALGTHVEAEFKRWGELIRKTGITMQ